MRGDASGRYPLAISFDRTMVMLHSDYARGQAGALIHQQPIGALQWRVALLCGAVAMLDGFDTQSAGLVTPAVAREWAMAPGQFGPVFAFGFLGLMIGAFVFGPLADRVGRRRVILATTFLFGISSLLTGAVENFQQLLALRFVTGLGLGGAMPNIVALTAEYAPERNRSTSVTLMFCGFPFGAVLGALGSSWLIETFGWRSIFVAGGVAPLLLCMLLWVALPESAQFLAARREKANPKAEILPWRDDPASAVGEPVAIAASPSSNCNKASSLRALFDDGRANVTALLWIVSFLNLLVMYSLVSWIPTLLSQNGIRLSAAMMGTALLNAGGVAGGIVVARWLDRRNQDPSAIVALFLIAAVGIALLGIGNASVVLIAALILSGVGVIGGQLALTSISASFYPVAIRSSGVGAMLGVGRVGAIVGPLAGGQALLLHMPTAIFFFVLASAALGCAVTGFLLARLPGRTPQ